MPDLAQVIAALEAQRAVLGDAVTDAALAPLRAQLAAQQQAAAQQLRLVSVLFLDVVGSTSLTQHLDPETVHDVMDGALAQFRAVVQQHGGRVLQFAGDSLLAAFGHDGAREDDAERAVRAGLALLQAGRERGALVLRDHGHAGFDVRVGVHTGTVLLGGGVDEGNTIRGMTVNIAARLEQTAPPGQLRISHDTWRHVQGLLEAQAQPMLQVKGRDGPLASWQVLRALPTRRAAAHPARGIQGLATPMFGRQDELAQLLQAVMQARHEGRVRSCTVLAEAGLGKSRLLHELLQHLDAQGGVPRLLARAHLDSRLQPYRLLRDMLAARLQIADSDDAGTARDLFVAGLRQLLGPAPAPEAEAPIHLLGQLIGMDFSASPHVAAVEPRQLRDRALAAFTQLLRSLAEGEGGPVLLIADDLHWADDASLDALWQLMAAELPLVVIGLARPELLERRPDWAQDVASHACITLSALDAGHSGALAAALLQRLPDAPPALGELLTKQAAGNPYYMEELLKMLIDDGVVGIEGAHWQVHLERLAAVRVPTTLTGVLQARLDSLQADERHALQQASIVGSVFWDDALAALDAQAPGALPELQRKALVRLRAFSAFEGTAEEAFGHHLLHQVAYGTVLKARRREGHAAAARWLAERVGGRSGEHLAATARHYEEAGEPSAALRWLTQAAEHAARRFDNVTALAHAERGIALAPASEPELHMELLRIAARSADLLARRDVQARAVAGMQALAAAAGAPAHFAGRAAYAAAALAMRQGHMPEARQLAQQAIAASRAHGPASICAEAYNLALNVARLQGDMAGAQQFGQAGLALAGELGLAAVEIRLGVNLALVQFDVDDWPAARGALARALELSRQQGQLVLAPLMLFNIACCDIELGDFAAALRAAEESAQLATALGEIDNLHMARETAAQALLGLGRLAEAREQALAAAAGLRASGARYIEGNALKTLGDIELESGDATRAAAHYAEARRVFAEVQLADWALEAGAAQALALLRGGQAGAALQALDPLRAHYAASAEADRLRRSPRPWWLGWQVLSACGDAAAAAWLSSGLAALQTQAARLPEGPVRTRFLEARPAHSALLRAARAADMTH